MYQLSIYLIHQWTNRNVCTFVHGPVLQSLEGLDSDAELLLFMTLELTLVSTGQSAAALQFLVVSGRMAALHWWSEVRWWL